MSREFYDIPLDKKNKTNVKKRLLYKKNTTEINLKQKRGMSQS